MSIWKEIKHALNSTLGTDNFQPLDKYLRSTRTINATTKKTLITNASSAEENLIYQGVPFAYCTSDGSAVESFKSGYPDGTLITSSSPLPVTLFKIKMLTSGSFILSSYPVYSSTTKSWSIDYSYRLAGNTTKDSYYMSAWYNMISVDVNGETFALTDLDDYIVRYKKGDVIHAYVSSLETDVRNKSSLYYVFCPCIFGKISDTSSIEYLDWEEVSE